MSKTNTRMLLRCAVFAALTAVGAFIRIPFALSSITLQFFFTAMAGLVLGARWGAASQAIYVLLGLAGEDGAHRKLHRLPSLQQPLSLPARHAESSQIHAKGLQGIL